MPSLFIIYKRNQSFSHQFSYINQSPISSSPPKSLYSSNIIINSDTGYLRDFPRRSYADYIAAQEDKVELTLGMGIGWGFSKNGMDRGVVCYWDVDFWVLLLVRGVRLGLLFDGRI